MSAQIARLLLCFALIGSFSLFEGEARQSADVVKVSRFSGKPLPRFESLRYSAVHGRQGPNLDHPIVWRYEREGLPMLIVRETHGWRRVRDPDGDEVWMQARMLSDTPTAMVIQDVDLKRAPDDESGAKATIKEGVIAELGACEAAWCRVKIGRDTGWLPKAALWGSEIETGAL